MSRYARERMWSIFVLAVVICAALTLIKHSYQRGGRSDPLTDITRRVLFSPILHGSYAVAAWWDTDIGSVFEGPRIAAENRRLRAQIANLMQEKRVLDGEALENEQLRILMKFKAHDSRQLLPAEILALKPFAERDTAVFSRGTLDNISAKQTALDSNGNLIGQVIDTSSTTCDVLLLTDTLSSVGARVVPPSEVVPPPTTNAVTTVTVESAVTASVAKTPPTPPAAPAIVGICVGNRSNNLDLIDLDPNADVHVGDTVVTSGLGGVYPKDIPIGRVTFVNFDKTRFLRSAIVAPYADFNHMQDGFLIE